MKNVQTQPIHENGGNHVSRRDFIKFFAAVTGGLVGINALRPQTEAKASGLPSLEKGALPYFEITGVPTSVNKSDDRLKHANEVVPAPGDVVHKNEIGFGTEHFLAEPGVRTLDVLGVNNGKFSIEQANRDLLDMENSAAYVTTPDKQVNFTQPGVSFFGPIEGGFTMYTASQMELAFGTLTKPIGVKLGAEENHTWIAIVKGQNRDYVTPDDLNLQVAIGNYNPGFTLGTRLPPGQYISEDYFDQNVASTQGPGTSCGADGCHKVSVAIVDATTGGYTVIKKDGPTAQWRQIQTNIK